MSLKKKLLIGESDKKLFSILWKNVYIANIELQLYNCKTNEELAKGLFSLNSYFLVYPEKIALLIAAWRRENNNSDLCHLNTSIIYLFN